MTRAQVGDPMPTFSLPSSDGTTLDSRTLLGHGPFVVYFYPRDETMGCTAEACAFRDDYEMFVAAGARVIGISPDSVESHRAFIARHNLTFTLLADQDLKVFRLFGVSDFLGLLRGRETFVMDKAGVVRLRFSSALRPTKHVREALAMVQRLGAHAPR